MTLEEAREEFGLTVREAYIAGHLYECEWTYFPDFKALFEQHFPGVHYNKVAEAFDFAKWREENLF